MGTFALPAEEAEDLHRHRVGTAEPVRHPGVELGRLPLDDLVGAPPTGDPRVYARPISRRGQTILPLSRGSGGLQAFKHLIPSGPVQQPEPRTHEGYEWLYVISGRVRLVLGDHDLMLQPGEAAEFDTRVPHWFGSAEGGPVEFLSIFGPQGERVHVRARSTRR